MQSDQIPLSLLDLVRVKQGSDAAGALAEAQEIATHVDRLGYNRYWVAEHHNMQSIASAANGSCRSSGIWRKKTPCAIMN